MATRSSGRAVGLETPVESRSLWERERDTQIALTVGRPAAVLASAWTLTTTCLALDPWAETVHNIPLLLGAELGLFRSPLWPVLLVGHCCGARPLCPRNSTVA